MDRARHLLDRFGHWRFVATWLVVIFGASSIPNYTIVTEPPRWPVDKLVHAGEYAVLSALVVAAATGKRSSDRRLAAATVVAFVLAAAYGASDEYHQLYVHGRDADVHDWMADVAGAATGAIAAAMLLRSREPRGS